MTGFIQMLILWHCCEKPFISSVSQAVRLYSIFSDISLHNMLTKHERCDVQGYLHCANKKIQNTEEQPGVREGLREYH